MTKDAEERLMDVFAAAAMPELMRTWMEAGLAADFEEFCAKVAAESYQLANAMLVERDQWTSGDDDDDQRADKGVVPSTGRG